MKERKLFRLSKLKKIILLVTCSLVLIVGLLYGVFPWEFHFYSGLSSSPAMSKWLPRWEQRRIAHSGIRRRNGFHTEFIALFECGNKNSVPLLIDSLKWAAAEGELNPEKGIVCTWGHCVEALQILTGEYHGLDAVAWQSWWESKGRMLPDEHFKPRKWEEAQQGS